MAGKSNKGRNRRGSRNTVNPSEPAVSSDVRLKDNLSTSEPSESNSNGNVTVSESISTQSEVKQPENSNSETQAKHGEVHLYPVSVKTQGGEKLELQLSPGDSVMDVRQFLLDAPETCFFTCYDLLLHAKDGSAHQLEDFNEISEVADITTGDCSLEMVAALYDDRSIRAHVHRTRELLSLSTLHSSLSTSLALQHETGKSTPANSGDSVKTEVPELDSLGFMEDVTGSLTNLLSSPSKEIQCVESIVFSSFNPPPSYRRLVGDLIYLDAITLEGNKFCITGTTQAFYVNSSAGNALDSRPNKAASESDTLIGLLQKISPKFNKVFDVEAFREILERKASAHPFENVQSLLPPNSWLGLYPLSDHKRDAARAENALTLTFGSELIGMQRDWNEELQSCREFPHTNPQERILRDRALYKVTSDFVDAAISGAIGVINRCIPPINPTDPECFHMYVHNNIFFSFAVDADLEQLSRKRATDANLKIESTSSLNNSSDKTVNKLSHAAASVSSGDKSNGPSTEDLDCSTHLASDVPAETQLTESEQATYASANNDLKGTRHTKKLMWQGFIILLWHAFIDYNYWGQGSQGSGTGDKSDSLLYGSVDNGKKICWNEDFHSKIDSLAFLDVMEAAKRLHLKEHAVFDGSGNVFKLAAPVECKGIVGSDDRHYLLDLMRVTPRDANYTEPGSRFCILRPELISGFCQAEAVDRPKNSCKMKEEHPGVTDSPVDGAEGQVITDADTALATSNTQDSLGCLYPKLYCYGNCRVPELPVDGRLVKIVSTDIVSNVLANGFNMRDLSKEGKHEAAQEFCPASVGVGDGDMCDEMSFNPNVFTEFKLAGRQEEITADEENVRKASLYLRDVVLPNFIQDLCTLEISPMDGQTLTDALHAHGINVRYIGKVAEGTKHLPHLWDLCSSEIVVRSAKHILKDALRESEDHDIGPALSHFFNCFFGNCQAAAVKVNPGMQSKAQKKFELPEDARSRVKKISVIRNLCQKVGISIAAHKYDLDAAAPFQISDILDLRPVVKHSIPVCSEARDLVETGKVQLAEGMLSEAYTLFSEAFTMLQQVTGPMHREVANCCRYLAMVLYHAGDMAGAIIQQHKELIINERCLGLDHPDTAHRHQSFAFVYGNMALFYHGLNQTELALHHMSRALLLLSLSSGPDHPDVAATFINVAMMYQDIGNMNTALRYLQEALKKNERLLGKEHIQTAVCYHALAIAFNCMGAFKLSHQACIIRLYFLLFMDGYRNLCLNDDEMELHYDSMRKRRMIYSSSNLERRIPGHMNAQKQKGQTLNADSAQKAIDILKALPRGRGVDERAVRAAAEVRRKAAARGLLIRPHGVPVQALPPLTQLLNIINSGRTPDAANNTETDGVKKEANGHVSNGPGETQEDPSKQGQQDPPVGLGTGLAALDSKKQKTKPKGAA
ncbi:tetratricopeptide repeat (TPR)-containing protein [Actinidia rufa]|uniref:Tetratricopeptide repeat (TPR)-containing protein n=1 Tax=Actinidia rufa TaxID=165716 RepID=A0A7J0FVP3_9ERIC|nr:tetratricopeptide repeat (TPR)-containing protein [Actinidia rufa]